MKRSFEAIDLAVAVGVIVTVFGGYLMFMASSGTFQPMGTEEIAVGQTPNIEVAIQYVEPALGQAIVDDTILEHQMGKALAREVRELNRVSMIDQRLRTAPVGFADRIRAYAISVEKDHMARTQWAMGRGLVTATARGVHSGALSAQYLDGDFNRMIISQALFLGGRMDEAFWTGWQERLGEMIVASSQDYQRLREQIQQRIGSSIVAVAQVQDGYLQKQGAVQMQLASAAIAAIHGEQIAERFAHLAAADFGTRTEMSSAMESHSWPEVPMGVFLMASVMLIGIFVAGIATPLPRSSRRMQETEDVEERYRKTA